MTQVTNLGITGHRGLPPETARLVDRAIREILHGYEPRSLVGISALADGADQLFARAVLDHGGRLEVIVPAAKYREGLPVSAHGEYDRLFSLAEKVHRLNYTESNEQAHMAASEYMVSFADELLAVLDGEPSRSYGGTADVVAHARKLGVPVSVVWPEGASRD